MFAYSGACIERKGKKQDESFPPPHTPSPTLPLPQSPFTSLLAVDISPEAVPPRDSGLSVVFHDGACAKSVEHFRSARTRLPLVVCRSDGSSVLAGTCAPTSSMMCVRRKPTSGSSSHVINSFRFPSVFFEWKLLSTFSQHVIRLLGVDSRCMV